MLQNFIGTKSRREISSSHSLPKAKYSVDCVELRKKWWLHGRAQ